MISWPHVVETAILIGLAYAIGCVVGVLAFRLAHRKPGPAREPAPKAVDLAAQIAARLPVPPPEPPPASPAPEPISPVLSLQPDPLPPASDAQAAVQPPPVPLSALLLPDEVPPEAAPAVPPASRPGKPKTLVKPRGGIRDDLKAIKGIGPKLEPRLNDLGIFHIAQIAGWSRANADWVGRELGFPGRVEREAWVAQAKALTPHPKGGKK